MIDRRRVLMGQNRFYSDYQEVEWIGGDGLQYIDTKYHIESDSFKVIGATHSDIQAKEMCVVGTSEAGFEIGFSSARNRFFVFSGGGSAALIPSQSIYGLKIEYEALIKSSAPTKTLILKNIGGGIRSTNSSSNLPTLKVGTIYFFNYSNNYYLRGRIYAHKFYETDILVRNFIPCYRKADGVIGMYDLCGSICPLTNTPFYINSGTGEFTKGADVK